MNAYWLIYTSGVMFALIYMTYDFIQWCMNKHLDYREHLRGYKIPFMIVLYSLGSWLTVILLHMGRERD